MLSRIIVLCCALSTTSALTCYTNNDKSSFNGTQVCAASQQCFSAGQVSIVNGGQITSLQNAFGCDIYGICTKTAKGIVTTQNLECCSIDLCNSAFIFRATGVLFLIFTLLI